VWCVVWGGGCGVCVGVVLGVVVLGWCGCVGLGVVVLGWVWLCWVGCVGLVVVVLWCECVVGGVVYVWRVNSER
jgi:hypothetical protein